MAPVEIILDLYMSGESWFPTPPAGFRSIVSLRLFEDLYVPSLLDTIQQLGPLFMWMPTADIPVAPDKDKTIAVTRFIHSCVMLGFKTLVHCQAGHNRSGYMVAATLIRHFGYGPQSAIELVQARIPGSLTNRVFVEALLRMG